MSEPSDSRSPCAAPGGPSSHARTPLISEAPLYVNLGPLFGSSALQYATLTAAVALFLAIPAIPWRKRLACLAAVVTTVFVATAVGMIVLQQLAISRSLHGAFSGPSLYRFASSTINSLTLTAPIAVVLVVWFGLTRSTPQHPARPANRRTATRSGRSR